MCYEVTERRTEATGQVKSTVLISIMVAFLLESSLTTVKDSSINSSVVLAGHGYSSSECQFFIDGRKLADMMTTNSDVLRVEKRIYSLLSSARCVVFNMCTNLHSI